VSGTQVPIPGLLLACAVTFGVGYAVAPREMLDEEVHYDGMFRTDTSKVLSTTVESLRQENKLLVFTYKGGARVWAERTRWIILHGRQELYVPAVVSYHVDLSRLTMANVSYDEQATCYPIPKPSCRSSPSNIRGRQQGMRRCCRTCASMTFATVQRRS